MESDPKRPSTEGTNRWSFGRRYLFWFVFVYFILYAVPSPFPISWLPRWDAWEARLEEPKVPSGVERALEKWDAGLTKVSTKTAEYWDEAVVFADEKLESVEVTARPRGSGDTTFNFVQDGMRAASALILGLLIALVAGRRAPAKTFRWGLYVSTRYYLAFWMMSYGFAKVIKTQFPSPYLERLLQPYGESSPMGLVWTFMGSSAPYNWFTGGAEVLGGLLLLFKRTTTLGALVSIGVVANIAMLNFAYDVPVKLFSSHLLLAAVGLAAIDAPRLLRFFVENRPVAPRDLSAPVSNAFLATLANVLKIALVTNVIWGHVERANMRYERSDGRARPELYGIWEVETFERDGLEQPPLLTDGARWRRLVVDFPGWDGIQRASVHAMDGTRRSFVLALGAEPEAEPVPADAEPEPEPAEAEVAEPAPGTITLRTEEETPTEYTLRLERRSESEIVLEGEYDGSPIDVVLTRRLPEDFELVGRGFHWVNEFPYNR